MVYCRGHSATGDYCGTKIGLQWSTAGGVVLMVTTVGQRLVCSDLLQVIVVGWGVCVSCVKGGGAWMVVPPGLQNLVPLVCPLPGHWH